MKKFTKIALITALVMLVTGGDPYSRRNPFRGFPPGIHERLERGTKNNSVFNRWFGNHWLERLTTWRIWMRSERTGKITGRIEENPGSETGLMKQVSAIWIGSDAGKKASIDASKVKSLYVTAEAGEIRIQPSSDEKYGFRGWIPVFMWQIWILIQKNLPYPEATHQWTVKKLCGSGSRRIKCLRNCI